MEKRAAKTLVVASIIVLGSVLASMQIAGATTSAGHTAGTYTVSSTGAAVYTIPLRTPPGTHGIEPHLALVYSSQAGDDYLGPGWSLSGLSAITRCNGTWAQDGTPTAVSLTMSDRFCLDGQRLRITSSGGLATYGEPGTTYQTEVANFSNIIASSTSAGNGPAYFTVQGKDGLYYEYGNPTDPLGSATYAQVYASGATTPYTWALDKVSDRAGNYLVIHYTQSSGSYVPSTIQYTYASNGGSTSDTVSFTYTTASPTQVGYLNGASVAQPNVLNAITVTYASTPVTVYNLGYTPSASTSRGLLTSIQECGGSAGTDCFTVPVPQITYQTGAIGISNPTISTGITTTGPVYAVDVNGDGRSDLVYGASVGQSYHWWVRLSTGNGYGSPIDTGIQNPQSYPILLADFLGNGKTDILAPYGSGWGLYQLSGNSIPPPTPITLSLDANQGGLYSYAVADLNGDGLPDLVWARSDGWLYTRLNTTTNGAISFSQTTTQAYQYSQFAPNPTLYGANSFWNSDVHHMDFNGDGREDVLLESFPAVVALTASGSTNAPTLTASSSVTGSATPLNWNDDRCTDLAVWSGNTSYVYVAPCNGQIGGVAATLGSGVVIATLDWDGDGRSDVVTSNGATSTIYLSAGAGVKSTVTESYHVGFVVLDVDGDGLDDQITYDSSGNLLFGVHNGAGLPPDLMSSVTDAYGNYVVPAYVSLPQGLNSYYGLGNDAPSGYKNYLGPLYVVANTTYSDPTDPGGNYLIWDYYSDAWMNLQGRGFAGFGSHRTYDTRNNVWETLGYDRAFPYTGMVTSDVATVGNLSAQTIFSVNRTPASTTLDATAYNERYFPYIGSDTRNDYEVSGPKAWQLITTTATTYGFDPYGNATAVTRTVTDEDSGSPAPPASPYYGQSWTTTTNNTPDVDTAHWCLSLLSETQTTYSSTVDSPAVTRTKQFPTPDLANCRYSQVVTEPSAQYGLTEAFGYDGFGNLSTYSISSPSLAQCPPSAPCTTTTNWWYRNGLSPTSVQDPTGATTQLGFSFTFGTPISVIDPNGVGPGWSYDDFGRMSEVNNGDPKTDFIQYLTCSQTVGCGYESDTTLARIDTLKGSNGTVIGTSETLYDQLERAYTWYQPILGGGTSRHQIRYDNLGRVVGSDMPCTNSDPNVACPYWTTTIYDTLSRPLQIWRPINSSNNNPQTTTYQYLGRTTTVTDPYGIARTTVRDVNGRLRETKDAYGYTVTLAYDPAGSVTAVTDSLGNTLWKAATATTPYCYVYGVTPLLLCSTDMDRGAWSYTVDALGEVTNWTDAIAGHSFSMTYDKLSRPLMRNEPDYFTQWTWGSSPQAFNVGQLASVCTGTGTNPTSCTSHPGYSEAETYDPYGRLYQRAITIPIGTSGQLQTFTYTSGYDSTTGFLTSLTYPTSTNNCQFILDYAYTNGILSKLTDGSTTCGSNGTVFWQANAQNAGGQITEETLGNNIVTNRTYDAVTHWLVSLQAGVGGGSGVKNLSFLYDEMGNVIQRQEQDNNLSLTESLCYDNDYRLDHTTATGLCSSAATLQLHYDPMGNIASRSDVAGGANWTYDPNRKHAVTEAGNSPFLYTYDANGNMNSWKGHTASWTSYNYLQGIGSGTGSTGESLSFSYGPDRQRWYQGYYNFGTGTAESTYYVGGSLEYVTSGSLTNYRHYIYAGSEPVAVYSRTSTGSNTVDYVLSDHQGSVAALTNSSGGTAVNESFTPYGYRRSPTTWTVPASNSDLTTAAGITRQAYTFQTQLGLWMGLNHMNGRVEDSVTGRFLSADPTVPDPTDPQSYNRYSYASNNPVTFTDPTGFDDDAAACPGGATCDLPPQPIPVPPPVVITGCIAFCEPPGLRDALPNPNNPQAGAGNLDFFDPQGLTSPPLGTPTPTPSVTLIGTRPKWLTPDLDAAILLIQFSQAQVDAELAIALAAAPSPVPTVLVRSTRILAAQGAAYSGLELLSGDLRLGNNWNIYSGRFFGNQFVKTTSLARLFKGLGATTLVLGVGIDLFEVSEGQKSLRDAGIDIGIGVVGLADPITAIPAAAYAIIANFYPGGIRGFYNDYQTFYGNYSDAAILCSNPSTGSAYCY